MKYEKMKNYGEGKFGRITGVQRRTFNKQVEMLRKAESSRRAKGGPKPKLSVLYYLLAVRL